MAHTIGQQNVLKTLLLCFLLPLLFSASLPLLPPSVSVKPNSLAVHVECWLFFEYTLLSVVYKTAANETLIAILALFHNDI